MENEIKLRIHGEAQAKEIQNSIWFERLQPGEQQTVTMRTRYYDTVARDLQGKAVMLRVRDENDLQVLTCKKGGERGTSGLYQREECGLQIDQEEGERIDDAELIEAFLDHIANGFVDEVDDWINGVFHSLTEATFECVAEVAFERTLYEISYHASRLEIAFDLGHFMVNGRSVGVISELEAELLTGNVDDLLEFGASIKHAFSLIPEERSKYERALIFANA